jgi:glycosyltransferase involved in cell wall biosynthesis
MTVPRRLSICYAAPGLHLVAAAGPTRNVLSLAEALSDLADVTIAFRGIRTPVETTRYRVLAIDPGSRGAPDYGDDNATRGLNPVRHFSYCRRLQAFARKRATSYDVVLEKGWRLSGLLVAAFGLQGRPGAVIENVAQFWSQPLGGLRATSKYLAHTAAEVLAGACSRRAPLVIAETEELKATLIACRGIAPDRIEVVGLGVDHGLFCPMEQDGARRALGLDPAVTLLLYVGGMDEYHDLEPVIEAIAHGRPASVELHLVGDGEYRVRYEEKARSARGLVRFHGHVPHAVVPQYIAAADVCLAPYRISAFHGGVVSFSTLKIPEYMACGRPVISVPSGHIKRLVKNDVSGFLFPNEVPSWASFVSDLPSRERLAAMGRAATRAVESVSWQHTAAQYLAACRKLAA